MKKLKKRIKKIFSEKYQEGQVARLLLILAIVIFVAIIITYVIIVFSEKPQNTAVQNQQQQQNLPVYEKQLGNIRFVFLEARDEGSTLTASDQLSPNFGINKELSTTERFVIISVGAQNMGKENIDQNAWDLGNIIDSEGRNFVPLDSYIVQGWLPQDNGCGKLLKPAFNPIPCMKIYEVSKKSQGLKIEILTGEDNTPANFSANKQLSDKLDLILK